MNRRMFLTSTSATALLSLIGSATISNAAETTYDLWEAKVDTILGMARDYELPLFRTAQLFGRPPQLATSVQRLRGDVLLLVRSLSSLQERIDNILVIHTWVCGRTGSHVGQQQYELAMARVPGFYCLASGRPMSRSLYSTLTSDDHALRLGSAACRNKKIFWGYDMVRGI